MKRYKLRPYVIPTLVFTLATTLFLSGVYMETSSSIDNVNYVPDSIIGEHKPVVKEIELISPYTNQNVQIGKTYYEYEAEEKDQENSIIEYEDTYMQNSGVDFTCEEEFDVISIKDGEVINVKEDDTLGTVVEIKHDNDYVSIYQSLSETSVKKGDKVIQGEVIGKSGTNKLDKELGNHLHFELYINGQMVNPVNYLNKTQE